MKHQIADDTGMLKHAEAIDFFNRLIIDLKLVLLHHENWQDAPMDINRLEEATKHINNLMQCRDEPWPR